MRLLVFPISLLVGAAACGHRAAPPAAVTPRASDGDDWIYRDLATGAVRRSSSLDTYRLTIEGERARLTVTSATTDQGADGDRLTGWQETGVRTFTGDVTPDGDERLLELHEQGSDLVWRWSCVPETHEVAPADAVRVPSDDAADTCGDEGRWSKPTRPMTVLACGDLAVAASPDLLEGIFAFARAPGLEHLVVDDDCVSGGGLRAIAPGGAIAPVR